MNEWGHTQNLDVELKMLEQRYNETPNRLNQYYILKDVEKSGFSEAPHDILRIRAEAFIAGGLDYSETHPLEFGKNRNPDPHGVLHLFLAFGSEILIKAITLMERPEWFIDNIDNYESPAISDCICTLMGVLSGSLDNSQKKRINIVLDLLNVQRNHIVHFNLSPQIKPAQFGPTYNVLRFLFSHFWNAELDIVQRLRGNYRNYLQRYDDPPYKIVELP